MATPPAPGNAVIWTTAGNVYAAATVLPILAAVFVALRFYVRKTRNLAIQADDWLIIPALLCLCGTGASLIVGLQGQALAAPDPIYNFSVDPMAFMDQDPPIQVLNEKLQVAIICLDIMNATFAKSSILFFYRRIFCSKGTEKHIFNLMTWVILGLIIAWGIGNLISSLAECGTHFAAIWGSLGDLIQYCPGFLQVTQAYVCGDTIMEGIVLFLPIPMIWRLQMASGRKLAVTAVFMLGFLSLAASIIRASVFMVTTNALYSNPDEVALVTTFFYFTIIENGLVVIAACLPTMRPLFGNFSPDSLLSSLRGVFSLRSSSSRSTTNLGNTRVPTNKSINSSKSSTSSEPCLVQARDGTFVETYATRCHDLEAQQHKGRHAGINVTRHIEQTGRRS